MSSFAGQEKRFHGIAVSPGIATGKLYLVQPETDEVPEHPIAADQIPEEISRLENALLETRAQIHEMQQQIAERIGAADAGIFDAHLLVVEDRTLIDEVIRALEEKRVNVEAVFNSVANRYATTLSQIDDPYLRERALDIHDVTKRVLRNLTGRAARGLADLHEPRIILAHNLTPSETAQLDRQAALGFATEIGSRTSHTAIMARSLSIPAVVGFHELPTQIAPDTNVLLDGINGYLIFNPTEQTLWEYGQMEFRRHAVETELENLREAECRTSDGRHIILSANIELPEDVTLVQKNGAEGIGLYRTEFLYLNKTDLPDEEEQTATYRAVADAVHPHPAIIRTLDLGGDKFVSSLNLPEELNPFLGWRAIRFCLEHPAIFKAQLRAILRASAAGNVKMMYPMISGIEELRRANALLEECRVELRSQGVPFDETLDVGMMIEVPSAALVAELLAREVAFFSIGTNDLIQYTIAVDRVNEKIAHLYEPTHPAILRLIKQVTDAAHAAGIWVGVCGEMAGEIAFAPLLIGLGVDELSAGAALVPRIKRAVQTLKYAECVKLADTAMHIETGAGILELCEGVAQDHFPELLS